MATIQQGSFYERYGLYEIVIEGSFSAQDQAAFTSALEEARMRDALIVAIACYGISFLHREGADLLLKSQKELTQKDRQFYLIGPNQPMKQRLSRFLMTNSFQERSSLRALLEELAQNVH